MRENNIGCKLKRAEESKEWVERYRRSGMSVRRFAEENEIKLSQLNYWIYYKHPQEPGPVKAPVFKEIKINGEGASWPIKSWGMEIGLPGGVSLRVGSNVDPGWVAEMVRQIRGVC